MNRSNSLSTTLSRTFQQKTLPFKCTLWNPPSHPRRWSPPQYHRSFHLPLSTFKYPLPERSTIRRNKARCAPLNLPLIRDRAKWSNLRWKKRNLPGNNRTEMSNVFAATFFPASNYPPSQFSDPELHPRTSPFFNFQAATTGFPCLRIPLRPS